MMAEYVEKSELLENIERFAPENMTPLLRMLVTKQPEGAVRCRNCKFYFRNNGHDKDGCPLTCLGEDGFCSFGERMEQNDAKIH